jgi:glycosyltransferase involved in cell wall biosynthesis
MLFSILIANYNNGSFFKDCYASIISQTYQDFEVIIVDDASTDNSVEVIQNLIEDDKRFKLFFNKKNKGCGYTKKKCATLASGEICGFVDPDDAIVASALEKMVTAFIVNPNICFVSSKYYLTDLSLNIIGKGTHGEKLPFGMSYLTYGNGAITHFCSFKKSSYLKTKGIDSKFKRAVDQDLYYKLEEVGCHLFLNDFLYYYRINSNSISANTNLFKAEYWHIVAKEDAFVRRLKNKVLEKSDFYNFILLKRIYIIQRMKRCVNNRKYWNKYYLLVDFLIFDFRNGCFLLDYQFKIKSLLFIKFPN